MVGFVDLVCWKSKLFGPLKNQKGLKLAHWLVASFKLSLTITCSPTLAVSLIYNPSLVGASDQMFGWLSVPEEHFVSLIPTCWSKGEGSRAVSNFWIPTPSLELVIDVLLYFKNLYAWNLESHPFVGASSSKIWRELNFCLHIASKVGRVTRAARY